MKLDTFTTETGISQIFLQQLPNIDREYFTEMTAKDGAPDPAWFLRDKRITSVITHNDMRNLINYRKKP